MKKIHLYDIHSPTKSQELIGKYITPPEFLDGKIDIKKEEFSGTNKYLSGYHGKWHIEINRPKFIEGDDSPFKIDLYYTGHGHWTRPAKVYLILEDIDD